VRKSQAYRVTALSAPGCEPGGRTTCLLKAQSNSLVSPSKTSSLRGALRIHHGILVLSAFIKDLVQEFLQQLPFSLGCPGDPVMVGLFTAQNFRQRSNAYVLHCITKRKDLSSSESASNAIKDVSSALNMLTAKTQHPDADIRTPSHTTPVEQ
jgi:hypothetical protein